jgi:hypothetical protein
MKRIQITPQMSAEFKSKYESSKEPLFKISGNGEVTHGCRAIEITDKAVFIYVSSFACCLGFWMPIETYKTMDNGYILQKGNKINFNNTIYNY